jgi:hypothetical protein
MKNMFWDACNSIGKEKFAQKLFKKVFIKLWLRVTLERRLQAQKVANWGQTYMAPVLEGKSNWFGPKNSSNWRAPDLENQESG